MKTIKSLQDFNQHITELYHKKQPTEGIIIWKTC